MNYILKIFKYVSLAILMIICDIIWILLFMKPRYESQISNIQNQSLKVNYLYAFFAYILMLIGLFVYCIPNIDKKNKIKTSLIYGFLFGLILYGVYDFTAAAVIRNWDMKTAIYDMIWGALLFGGLCLLSSYM